MNSQGKHHNFPKFLDIANKYKPLPNNRNKILQNIKNNIQKFSSHNINLLSNFSSDNFINNVNVLLSSNENINTNTQDDKFIKINFEKFISLKFKLFINLVSFCDIENLIALYNSNKLLRQAIIKLIKKYILSILDKFQKAYAKFLKIYKAKICFINKKNYNYANISLILISEVFSDSLINKTVSLGYYSKFFCDKENYRNTYIIDVFEYAKPLSFWIMKENTRYHDDKLNKAYFLPVMKVCLFDLIETSLNIFTNKGLLDINFLKWVDLKIENNKLNPIDSNREYKEYSPRICELEAVKYKWYDISKYSDKDILYSNLIKLFTNIFIIEKVEFSNMSELYLKIYLIAYCKGELRKGEIGIDLKVKGKEEKLSNEVKKNFLIYDMKNELECRIGDKIIFYYSYNM